VIFRAWHGEARRGAAWHGGVWLGNARRGKARHGFKLIEQIADAEARNGGLGITVRAAYMAAFIVDWTDEPIQLSLGCTPNS
jgi:hypothetical protein